jgi:flavin-dependent dehydrogenase
MWFKGETNIKFRFRRSCELSLTEDYDVIVVGGGPAGSTAALSLVRVGYSVAILERSDYANPRVGETLPPAVKALLAHLGLWDTFLHDSPSSSPAIYSAWGSETLHELNHFYNPYGMGWHIDRRRFDAMLVRVAQDAGATLKEGARIVVCEENASGAWTVGFRSGDAHHLLRARFLLDATGRSSTVARRMGALRVRHDSLVGVVGFFAPDSEQQAHSPITLIEAAENGWWYSAPLPGSRLVIAYMTDADVYAAARRQSPSTWLEQLGRTTYTQARATKTSKLDSGPLIVPANSSRLNQVYGDNWLAVGDAALSFDPISGQGVYRALESGMRGESLVQAFFAGERREFASYADNLREVFNQLLALRGKYYSQERRWPHSVFWQRRQGDGGISGQNATRPQEGSSIPR